MINTTVCGHTNIYDINAYLCGTVEEGVTKFSIVYFELENTVHVWQFKVYTISISIQFQRSSDEGVDPYELHLNIIAVVCSPCTVFLKFLYNDAIMLLKWTYKNILV